MLFRSSFDPPSMLLRSSFVRYFDVLMFRLSKLAISGPRTENHVTITELWKHESTNTYTNLSIPNPRPIPSRAERSGASPPQLDSTLLGLSFPYFHTSTPRHLDRKAMYKYAMLSSHQAGKLASESRQARQAKANKQMTDHRSYSKGQTSKKVKRTKQQSLKSKLGDNNNNNNHHHHHHHNDRKSTRVGGKRTTRERRG